MGRQHRLCSQLYQSICSSKGKCAITKRFLMMDEAEGHHINPRHKGGTDEYANIAILSPEAHLLVKVTNPILIKSMLAELKPNKSKWQNSTNFVLCTEHKQSNKSIIIRAVSSLHLFQQQVYDGTPCAVKVACTVWSGGKSGDYIKDYLSL